MTSKMPAADHAALMDDVYRRQRFIYDLTRKYYLFGRDKLIREAEGYASRRHAESSGEIEALLAKYHAYQRAPEITRQRLYLEAMQDVLQGVKNKTIIDSELKQLLPLLNLDARGDSSR